MKTCRRGIHQYPDTDKQCKECRKINIREYNQANKKIMKIYYLNNKERMSDRKKIYYQDNKAAFLARSVKCQVGPAAPKWLTAEHLVDITEIYQDTIDLQWLSEELLNVDHIVPLNGKTVSGLHVPWNLQILTRSKNRMKGNKLQQQS